ncbi:unnamed protein product [Sphagnum balticum]
MARREGFASVLRRAVSDFQKNGFTSQRQLEFWVSQLTEALKSERLSNHEIEIRLRKAFGAIYNRLINKGQILRNHPSVERWQIDRLTPKMRQVLDQKILASVNLIKLNQDEVQPRVLRRFQGWATSIPDGGSKVKDKEAVDNIAKGVNTSYEIRRVQNDQGHKLIASINEVVAQGNNAIAVEWHSHWKQAGYNYREDHKDRDKEIYVIKGSWALDRGLIKKGPNPYYDDLTKVGEEINCRCYATYIYSITQLPVSYLTEKGKSELDAARERVHKRA